MTDEPRALGRLQQHDPRSFNFPAAKAPRSPAKLADVGWHYYGAVLDQGQVGACTGFAATACLMCDPYWPKISPRHPDLFTEVDAYSAYHFATVYDAFAGTWEPDDTGSSGLAAMKGYQAQGIITRYTWAFGLDEAMRALALGPVITGTVWTTGMYRPDSRGFIRPTGTVVGGHEYVIMSYSRRLDAVRMLNSWGTGWGDRGWAWIARTDWGKLLSRGGDVTVPVP